MENRFITVRNKMFEGEFYYDIGELCVKKWKSKTVTIPEFIAVDGKKMPLYSLDGSYIAGVDEITLSSNLVRLKPGLLHNGNGVNVVIPKFCPAILQYYSGYFNGGGFYMNRYDNAYYIGSEENPYEYLYMASSDRIVRCRVHKETKYIHRGAFLGCNKLKQLILNDHLEACGSSVFSSFNKELLTEYEGGYYIGSKDNPYYAFVESDPSYPEVHLHENTKCILNVPEHPADIFVNENMEFIAAFYYDESEKDSKATLHFCKAPKGYELFGDDCLCQKKNDLLVRVIGRIDGHVFDGVNKFFASAFSSARKDKLIFPEHITAICADYAGGSFKEFYFPKTSALRYFNYGNYSFRADKAFGGGDIQSFIHCSGYNEISFSTIYVLNPDGSYAAPEEVILDAVPDKCLNRFQTIRKVTVKEGVEQIGREAFSGCTKLEYVQLPSTLKKIGTWAFWGCESLKSLTIPEGTEELGKEILFEDENIKEVYLPKSLKKIDGNIFSEIPWEKYEITLHYNGTYEDFLKIELNGSRSFFERYTTFIGTSLLLEINQKISCFPKKNQIMVSGNYYFFIYEDIFDFETKLKMLPVSSCHKIVNYHVSESAIALRKSFKEKIALCRLLDLGYCIEFEMKRRPEPSLKDFIERVNCSISAAHYEDMEMGVTTKENMPLIEYLKSISDDGARYIKEINAIRQQLISPLYEYELFGEKILLTLEELIKVSGDGYSKYFTDNEILEILNQLELQ